MWIEASWPRIRADNVFVMIEYENKDNWIEVREPLLEYHSYGYLNEITYKTIGCCFDVYNELGRGFSEVIYKDALEYGLKKKGIGFAREKQFEIRYKDIILPHYFYADFVVSDLIILEIKAQQGVIEEHVKQVLNYLAISGCDLGLLVNFGESSLKYKV